MGVWGGWHATPGLLGRHGGTDGGATYGTPATTGVTGVPLLQVTASREQP